MQKPAAKSVTVAIATFLTGSFIGVLTLNANTGPLIGAGQGSPQGYPMEPVSLTEALILPTAAITRDPGSPRQTARAELSSANATQHAAGAFGTADPFWGTPFSPDNPLPTCPPGYGELQFIQRAAGNGRIIEDWNDQMLLSTFMTTNGWIQRQASGYLLVAAGYSRGVTDGKGPQSGLVIQQLADSKSFTPLSRETVYLPVNGGAAYILDARQDELLVRTIDNHFFWYQIETNEFEAATASEAPLNARALFVADGEVKTELSADITEYFFNEWTPSFDPTSRVAAGAQDVRRDLSKWSGMDFAQSRNGLAVFDGKSADLTTPTWYFPGGIAVGLLRVIGETASSEIILIDSSDGRYFFDLDKRIFVPESEVDLVTWPWYDRP